MFAWFWIRKKQLVESDNEIRWGNCGGSAFSDRLHMLMRVPGSLITLFICDTRRESPFPEARQQAIETNSYLQVLSRNYRTKLVVTKLYREKSSVPMKTAREESTKLSIILAETTYNGLDCWAHEETIKKIYGQCSNVKNIFFSLMRDGRCYKTKVLDFHYHVLKENKCLVVTIDTVQFTIM